MNRTKIALALLGSMTLIAPAMAQTVETATAPTGEKINQLIIYGDDDCPQSTDDQIVVCARMGEAERYRIPENLRGAPDIRSEAWTQKVSAYEYVGKTGTMSCSATGAGGFTGCGLKEIDAAYAEKKEDPGIRFGLLIAEARKKRLAGIDAEAEDVEKRVQEYERQEAERKKKLEEQGNAPAPTAEEAAADAEQLPEPE